MIANDNYGLNFSNVVRLNLLLEAIYYNKPEDASKLMYEIQTELVNERLSKQHTNT